MATASGWAYYYKIRPTSDHMDTLRLYKDYKFYWDKHRIPGETKINEVLWEDTWWKVNSPFRNQKKLPPITNNKKTLKKREKSAPANESAPPAVTQHHKEEVRPRLPSIESSKIVQKHDVIVQKHDVIVPNAVNSTATRSNVTDDVSSSGSSRSSSSMEAEISV